MLARGLSEATLNDYIAFAREGTGAPIMEHFPEFIAIMEEKNNKITARLGELFSPDRMADLMEMEAIVKFEDEAHRRLVVNAFRQAE